MKWSYSLSFLALLFTLVASGQRHVSPHIRALTSGRIDASKELVLTLSAMGPHFRSTYSKDIKIISKHSLSGSYTIKTTYGILQKMINDPQINFIDIARKPKEESALDDANFRYNRVRTVQANNPNLVGKGKVLALKEEQFDDEDIDLKGKKILIGLEISTFTQHATSMATIISGKGNTLPQNQGVAPDVHLISSDYNNLLPDDEKVLTDNEAFIENHSYGIGIENYYGVEAAAYDASISEEPRLLHVFSSGNIGTLKPTDGTYAGLAFANLTGTFKQAKNVLVVSAVDTSLYLSARASKGPAYDGRVKPELAAYGGRGTSDAAALVTGISALVQEAYKLREDDIPESSLVKAMLIASADDINLPGLDFHSGYGSVNAKNALKAVDNNWYGSLVMSSEDSQSLDFTVPDGVSHLRLAVCWVDPAAASSIEFKALINDIDAKLNLGVNQWLPWVLDPSPDENLLNQAAVRKEDHLNNVEFFTLDQPAAGDYSVSLSSPALDKPQKVQIAWFYEMENTFEWDFPKGTHQLVAGEKERVYWSSTIDQSGKLYYKPGNGDWNYLSDIDAGQRVWQWEVPDTTLSAQLKMVIGTQEFVSDPFFISQLAQKRVSFNCVENFGLEWSPLDGASEYIVYEMGDTLMQVIGTTADTSFTIKKNTASFYTVAPKFGNIEGLRSLAFDYQQQGTFCYLNLFSAQLQEDYSVEVKLDLSTTSNIRKIDILKFYNGNQEIFKELNQGFGRSISLTDTLLHPGTMGYKAILYFENGNTIESDLVEIYVQNPKRAILFPNPVSDGYLSVLSDGGGLKLRLFSRNGKFLLEKELDFNVEEVIVQDFRSGLYLYQLVDGKKVIDTGKLIIR